MNEQAIRALIAKWQEREDRHRARAEAAEDSVNFDRQESAAYATMLCKRELEALLAAGEAAEMPQRLVNNLRLHLDEDGEIGTIAELWCIACYEGHHVQCLGGRCQCAHLVRVQVEAASLSPAVPTQDEQ